MNGKNLEKKQINSIRICVLIDAWEPIWGGAQVQVWEIARRLVNDLGYEIDIYTRTVKDETDSAYIQNENSLDGRPRVIRIGPATHFFNPLGRISWLLTVVLAVVRNFRKQPYQLIHGHSYSAAIPAKILNWWLGLPVLYTVHASNNLDRHRWNIATLLEYLLLTRIKFNQEISVSEHFLRFRNVNKNIAVIPNGVDTSLFDSVKPKNHPHFTILWVGRFDPVKGVEVLLRAFAQIARSQPYTRLVLVGYGYNEKNYRRLVQKLGINEKVRFMGKLTGRALVKEYKRADLFVLPSFSEGFPLTLLEAWAARLPVVATRVGDNERLIKEGQNGFLVQPGNVKELTQVLLHALHKSDLSKLGVNGYQMVKHAFTWEKAAAQHQDVYSTLL